MGREFSVDNEIELDVTPQQVWEAIATGPGIDSWFMGRNEVTSGENGAVQTVFGDYSPISTITAWDPLKRMAYGSGEAENGRSIAYEFLIEARDQGSSVLKMVTSGFLPGDDWQDEYDAMIKGGALFFQTLVAYLTHFPDRSAVPITTFGPPITDWPQAWIVLREALGLTDAVAIGDRVRLAPAGLTPIDGVVYFVNEHTLGIRTKDTLYRFLQGFHGPLVVGHHLFSAHVDQKQTELAWQSWLNRLFG